MLHMPTDAEITFADHAGRLYARRYGIAPVVGRLLGYLAICDPREQSIADLAEALLASRSAIAGAVKTLEQLGLVRRSRAAGERMDRVGIDLTSRRALGFDPTEYQEQAALAREGLAFLADAPPERRAVLHAEIRSLLAPTALAAAEIVDVSALTGEGISGLTDRLAQASARHRRRAAGGQTIHLHVAYNCTREDITRTWQAYAEGWALVNGGWHHAAKARNNNLRCG